MHCPRCGHDGPEDDFARDRTKASGRKSHCKTCDAARSGEYYENNREAVIARVSARQRQEANRG